jgi:hypothetical protein
MGGAFENIEIRVGTLTINRGDAGDPFDPGNVRLVNYGPLDDKYPISDPTTNALQGVIEFTKGLFAEFTFDDHSWELFQKWLGITAATTGAATPALPTDVPIIVYVDKGIKIIDTLGKAYTGPYGSVAFATTPNAIAPDLVEGTDYEFGATDGDFIVNEADPSGIDGIPIYIQTGTYTTVASRQFNFDDSETNTKAEYTYTKNLRNGKVFTLYIPTGYVIASPAVTHKPDGTTEYMVRVESVWNAVAAGYELGYIKFTT